jgi:hypothetical protein
VYPEAAALAFQIIILWTAFFALQCSKPKGHPKFTHRTRYFESLPQKKKTDEEDKDPESDSDDEEAYDEYEKHRLNRKRSCLCCCCCPRYTCCKGDRLINFMLFDLLCFCLVIGWLCYYTFVVNRF